MVGRLEVGTKGQIIFFWGAEGSLGMIFFFAPLSCAWFFWWATACARLIIESTSSICIFHMAPLVRIVSAVFAVRESNFWGKLPNPHPQPRPPKNNGPSLRILEHSQWSQLNTCDCILVSSRHFLHKWSRSLLHPRPHIVSWMEGRLLLHPVLEPTQMPVIYTWRRWIML